MDDVVLENDIKAIDRLDEAYILDNVVMLYTRGLALNQNNSKSMLIFGARLT